MLSGLFNLGYEILAMQSGLCILGYANGAMHKEVARRLNDRKGIADVAGAAGVVGAAGCLMGPDKNGLAL